MLRKSGLRRNSSRRNMAVQSGQKSVKLKGSSCLTQQK
jgi:hypothetical protein